MERLTQRESSYCEDICFTYGCDSDGCEHEEEYDIYEKLRDYEDLEEQGLLLRLPCKVGASVYMVGQDCGGDALYCRRGDCEGCPDLYEFIEENKFEAYMLDEVGKTVFLTQAEAEAKLKEMEGE